MLAPEPFLPAMQGRYELRRKLGEGGGGTVYEVFDADRRQVVALKALSGVAGATTGSDTSDGGTSIGRRLKREFRALSTLAHPNLVALYELVLQRESGFFTMELVEGVPFTTWVRGAEIADTGASGGATVDLEDRTWDTMETAPIGPAGPQVEGAVAISDVDRLRAAFRQLAEGVAAIHAHGRVHRDLKPSNVLVERSGRVVILDFGLMARIDDVGGGGTARYMAPEQVGRRAVGPAADWYAVGTMLFECLTGRAPFVGTPGRLVADKLDLDAPDPHALCDGLPDDLVAVCRGLLARDPQARLDGAAVLAAFGAPPPEPAWPDHVLVGRNAELERLERAWTDVVATKRPVVVGIHGPSGSGKSAVANAFVHEHERVLRSRCFEAETAPFQALDELIDSLVTELDVPEDANLVAAVPHLELLSGMFPAMRQVPAVAALSPVDVSDPRERRELAFQAAVQAVVALAPVVVLIDDAHWGEADSASVFARLAQAQAPVLILLVYRSEQQDAPFVKQVLSAGADTRVQAIGALAAEAIDQYARALLPDAPADALDWIARESRGGPLFVQELARRWLRGERTALSLDDAIRARVNALPGPARELIQAVALAGQPTRGRVIAAAAHHDAPLADLARLRAGRLVRVVHGLVEPFHDRIREAVTAGLAPAAKARLHIELGDALAAEADADPERVGLHLEAGGALTRAVPYLSQAADRAIRALAFDHAAKLLQRARHGVPADKPGELLRILERLGDACVLGARGVPAAEAWLEAAPLADRNSSIVLKRRAAELLVAAGHMDRGRELFDECGNAIGVSIPRGYRAVLSVLWWRFRTWWRGSAWTPRTTPLPIEDQLRIDHCDAVMNGYAWADPVMCAAFEARELVYALDAGDIPRVIRACFVHASMTSYAGGPAALAEARHWLDKGKALSKDLDDPELLTMAHFVEALVEHFGSRYHEALAALDQAEKLATTRISNENRQLQRIRVQRSWVLCHFGRWKELGVVLDRLQSDPARDTPFIRYATLISGGLHYRLATGRIDECELALAQMESGWSPEGYHVQHHDLALGRAHLVGYRGDSVKAFEMITAEHKRLQWSLLGTSVFLQFQIETFVARYACARAWVTRDPAHRAAAVKIGRGIARFGGPTAVATAGLVEAGMKALAGDTEGAIRDMKAHIPAMEAAGEWISSRAYRRWVAELSKDTLGLLKVDSEMIADGTVDNERYCRFTCGRNTI